MIISNIPIDISIGHFERLERIELRFPEKTRLLLQAMASRTRRYIGSGEVIDILAVANSQIVEDLVMAQDALDQMIFNPGRSYLTLEEAHNALDLIICTTLFEVRNGAQWEQSRTMLFLVAEIVRYKLEPLEKICGDSWPEDDPAISCYEHLRMMIGDNSHWASMHDVHSWAEQLKTYRGKNMSMIRLERRLGALSKPFRLVLEKIKLIP
jgi:hypothetical protein